MIMRIWHGWTTHENAKTYETLLKEKIFPSIAAKQVKGYRKISLLKRPAESEVEFITMMLFDDLEAVISFAGENYEKAYVPEIARKVLHRYDSHSKHYDLIDERLYT